MPDHLEVLPEILQVEQLFEPSSYSSLDQRARDEANAKLEQMLPDLLAQFREHKNSATNKQARKILFNASKCWCKSNEFFPASQKIFEFVLVELCKDSPYKKIVCRMARFLTPYHRDLVPVLQNCAAVSSSVKLQSIAEESIRRLEKDLPTYKKYGKVIHKIGKRQSSLTDRVQEYCNEFNLEAAKLLAGKAKSFRRKLKSTLEEKVSFPATDQGYTSSFLLIDSLQTTAMNLRQVLCVEGNPVLVTRKTPPVKKGEKVVFEIADWQTLAVLQSGLTQLPQMSSMRAERTSASLGEDEIVRQRRIEQLRLMLQAIEGDEVESNAEARVVVKNLNDHRRVARVSFGYKEEDSQQITKVSLVAKARGFRLLRSTDNYSLKSSVDFPEIYIFG